MKLLFDENLAARLVQGLKDVYPGSSHVANQGLQQGSDLEIWEFAKENSFAIVSKDDDFLQHSAVHGHPPKVILIRIGNCSTAQIMELLRRSQSDLNAFADDETSSVLVLR